MIMPPFQRLLILGLAALITACGGSGGNGSASNNGQSKAQPEPAPQAQETANDGSANEPVTPTPSNQQTPNNTTSKTVTVSWDAPTRRVNGRPLQNSEIDSFEIYYFNEDSDSEGEIVVIDDAQQQQARIQLSTTGTYHFAVAAIDTDGIASDNSEPIAVTISL